MQLNAGLQGWAEAPHSSMSVKMWQSETKINERCQNTEGGRSEGEKFRARDCGRGSFYVIIKATHITQLLPWDEFVASVSDIFSIFSFLRALLLQSLYRDVGCLYMPQFLPLEANSTASVCTRGGQSIAFYPPLCSPEQKSLWSRVWVAFNPSVTRYMGSNQCMWLPIRTSFLTWSLEQDGKYIKTQPT